MGKKLVILGGAESGVGAAVLGLKKGYEVFLSDNGTIKDRYRPLLQRFKIEHEEGGHTEARILAADLVVKSPGIPEKAPIIKKLREKGVEIISEIEFASRYTKAKIIAITGSNGKSTCTSLTFHILKRAGFNVGLAGNIGQSFALQVALEKFDYYVLEVSSFQLDDIGTAFKPHIAILLNITPDHLDRYDYKFENYVASKFKIIQNQDRNDHFIYCADDQVLNEVLRTNEIQAQTYAFGLEHQPDFVGYTQHDQLTIHHKTEFKMSINELALVGKHNVYNSMAAGIAARIYDIRKEVIRESLSDFQSLDHRLEFVAKIGGVEYINDSKATNVNSTWYALESMTKPVIWIVGGVDKGNDYEILKPIVQKKVKAIVCLGTNNLRIHEAFSRYVDILVNTTSAPDAVQAAHNLADKGDVVLLSPACASFDIFENYEDRGNQFKASVRAL